MLFFVLNSSFAEGTRQLAPNESINIGANTTTDLAALFINSDLYNNFASYTNPDPNSRLYVNIQDPSTECIYLGFTFAHLNQTSMTPQRVDYEFRVKDPAGNIIFGPIEVTTTGGNIVGWEDAHTGPMQLFGSDGYDALRISSADLMSGGWNGEGDFYVEFLNTSNGGEMLIDFWDITVADCSTSTESELLGRVWSYNWAIFAVNDFGFPNRPFNGAFYVCAPDPQNLEAAFITRIDFNESGFRPAAFNIAFNSFGSMNTGNVMADRRSVENLNATQAEYAVFLNDPVDICETADTGSLELIGVTRCNDEEYCIKFVTTKQGQIDLLLDFDGPDDQYTPGTADVMLSFNVEPEQVFQPTCVDWDGKDGLGNSVADDPDAEIPILIAYAQGIYHFPIYDAELMTNGYRVEAVRPTGPEPLLFYDDSQITVPSGSGEPAIQLSGCTLPCHRWTNYTDNATPGFGNLHTINSWWFSRLVVRKEIFFIPAYLTCEISGPDAICEGTEVELIFGASTEPAGADAPEVIELIWSGPGIIGSSDSDTLRIDKSGVYELTTIWVTALSDTCSSSCEFVIGDLPPSEETIDTLIREGDSVGVNGEVYTEAGQYMQVLTAQNGCDSILTINVIIASAVIHFDLDDCMSNIFDGSGRDYTEFVPKYPNQLSCAQLDASIIYRDNPQQNGHSCTPGVDGSPAMCVGALDDCSYDAGNEKSIIFEVNIDPAPDTAVAITNLSFFERSPEMFDWIDGESGDNNYPTLYGVRVLKNGMEIFRQEDLAATADWSEVVFNFGANDDFTADTTTTFRFEFLAYCLIDNGSLVAAWDIDEVLVNAACVSPPEQAGIISGVVQSLFGYEIPFVDVVLAEAENLVEIQSEVTDEFGTYQFNDVPFGVDYEITADFADDYRNGVSTLDLVLIQKHLLEIEPFDLPLKYIAADANHSGNVSALDLVELRKLILGLYLELPANKSWRIGSVVQDVPINNPWSFRETLTVPDFSEDQFDADLIGVKIGDLNGDAQLFGSPGNIDLRSSTEPLHLTFDDKYVQAGEEVTVEVLLDGVSDVEGLQFALTTSGMIIQGAKSDIIDRAGLYLLNGQEVRISGVFAKPVDFGAATPVIELNMLALKSGRLSEFLTLDVIGMSPELYAGKELRILPLVLNPGLSRTTGTDGFELRVAPNPFSESTTLFLKIEQAGSVEIDVYDVAGKRVAGLQQFCQVGEHTIDLTRAQFGDSGGVFVCRVKGPGFAATRKVVLSD